MILKISVLFLGCSCFAAGLLADSSPVFVESQGKVVMEAESVITDGDWSLEKRIGDYKGTGYYVWRGDDMMSANKAGLGDAIQYKFRINKAGNYELRWRSYIAKGTSRTDSNDSWARFPTGKNISGEHALEDWTKVYMNTAGDWSWAAKTVDRKGYKIRQYFSTGDHVMEIAGRSNGHAIDRIVLFNYDELSYSADDFDNFKESKTSTESSTLIDEQANSEPDLGAASETPDTESAASETSEPTDVDFSGSLDYALLLLLLLMAFNTRKQQHGTTA